MLRAHTLVSRMSTLSAAAALLQSSRAIYIVYCDWVIDTSVYFFYAAVADARAHTTLSSAAARIFIFTFLQHAVLKYESARI